MDNRITELSKDIGKRALWSPATDGKGEIKFEVVIKEIELKFGNPYYTIIPVSGQGEVRVRERLEIQANG